MAYKYRDYEFEPLQVKVSDCKDLEHAIRRFNKKMKKEEIIKQVLDRRFYEKPSTKRNKKNRRLKRMLKNNRG